MEVLERLLAKKIRIEEEEEDTPGSERKTAILGSFAVVASSRKKRLDGYF